MNLVGVYNPSVTFWDNPYETIPQAQISLSAVAYDDNWITESGMAEKLNELFLHWYNYYITNKNKIIPIIPVSSFYPSLRSMCIIGGSWYMTETDSSMKSLSACANVEKIHSKSSGFSVCYIVLR